jgi:hypothetical protein
MRKGDRISLLVSNLTNETQTVRVRGLSAPVGARSLDADTAIQAMREPEEFVIVQGRDDTLTVELSPYATRFLVNRTEKTI